MNISLAIKNLFKAYSKEKMNFPISIISHSSTIPANSPDYVEQTNQVRIDTYKEIILNICNFYNLTFTGDFDSMQIMEVYGIAHTLYDIFISRFTDHMFNFFVSYIVTNSDSIAAYLKNYDHTIIKKDNGVYSAKNYIDPKYIIIHANINKVIYNMAGYDISLNDLLAYFLDQAKFQRISSLLIDNGDIYKTHYASFILDQRFSASVLTNIKLKLQSRTQEVMNIIG